MSASLASPAVQNGAPAAGAGVGVLVVLLAGTFMAGLDFFIVNVALPSIATDLTAGPSSLEWVVAGYGLPYGVLLIAGARLGDVAGRRRVFLLGIAAFAVASLLCGSATTATMLIAGRVIQGAAAAALSPQVLATVTALYTGHARARAVDAFAATIGAAAVTGQLIGGALINANIFGLGWRACFLINVPIGIAVFIVGCRVLPRAERTERRIDWVGTVIAGAALTAVVLPLIEGREYGWPTWTWVTFALGAFLLTGFVVHQRSVSAAGRNPLVDMSLFADRGFSVGLTVQLVFWMGQAAFFLILALYCQNGLKASPLQAGLIFLPLGVGYLVTSMTARHVAVRIGRQAVALGALGMLSGEILLVTATHHVSPHHLSWLIAPLVIDGFGMGLAVGPLVATILAAVEPPHVGAASGILATGQQIGNSLGVAIIGVVFYNALDQPATPDVATAFRHGLFYLTIVAALVVAMVQALPRRVLVDPRTQKKRSPMSPREPVDLPQLVEDYIMLWHIDDDSKRRRAVESLFSVDIRHETSASIYDGLDAMQARIQTAYDTWVKTGIHRFTAAGTATAHHSTARLRWHMIRVDDETVVSTGSEFLVLNDSGRINADYQYIES